MGLIFQSPYNKLKTVMINQRNLVKCSIILLIYFCYVLPFKSADGRKNYNRRQNLETEKHKGTVKTIESENGDVIDCVDIYKQPSFDHPYFKNHIIQLQRSTTTSQNNGDKKLVIQEWNKNGESCPKGSIPILRSPKLDYPKKVPFNIAPSTSTQDLNPKPISTFPGHEYAQAQYSGNSYGAKATINVWNPFTFDKEISIAQIWVVYLNEENTNTIEAGWIANNNGQKETRTFIYWTSDYYNQTGCYNLLCPGFVQVSSKFVVGSELKPISTLDNDQFDFTFSISKELISGHWWLNFQGEDVGYWPSLWFTRPGLADVANLVSWGGEIVNFARDGKHTTTQMGSGRFPEEGFKRASYFRSLEFFDGDSLFKEPKDLRIGASKPNCYNISLNHNPQFGFEFYFGGPGYSNLCLN